MTWHSYQQDGDSYGAYGQRFDSDGNTVGSEFQVNTYTTSDQTYTSVAAFSGGGFVVTWGSYTQDGSDDGIYGQMFDASGNKDGSEFPVNTYTTDNQSRPSVATLSGGGFVVMWESDGQDGSGEGIYGQLYDSAGNTVGSEFQVNTYTTGDQEEPRVTALSGNCFMVTWESDGQDGDSQGVYGQLFDGSGNKVGSEFRVNTYTTGYQGDQSVAALSGGSFMVAWGSDGQDGSFYGVYGQIFGGSDGKLGSEFQVNTYTTNFQGYPSIAALSSGGFVVTWDSDGQDGSSYGVYGQMFGSSGSQVGGEFEVNTYTTDYQRSSSVAALSGGSFVITWRSSGQDGSDYGVYGQLFHSSGTKVGAEFQVNTYTTNHQQYPSVAALSSGGFVVTWESFQDGSNFGIYGQMFDNSANKVGSEFQVNTHTTYAQAGPSIAALSDGGFVVTWRSYGQDGDDYGAYGQMFDITGTTVGSEFQINTYTTGSQGYPLSVAGLSDGGFVVAWESSGQDGGGYGVYGQLFDSTGNMVGSEFRVNIYTTGDQKRPSVAALSGGGFVVTSESNHQDGSDYGVYGQLFDSAGNTIGSEFQANTYTTSSQQYPSVAALSWGGFAVMWASDGQDGSGLGVYGQMFMLDPIGDELAVDFGASGLWHYRSSWDRLSSLDCEGITAWDQGLADDVGTGLFNYDGTSWKRLSTWDAENVIRWENTLAVDFGTGKGLFTYNGAFWKRLSTWDCEGLVECGDDLIIDFGTGKGLFSYHGTTWKRLSTWDPEVMAEWNNDLAVDFGSGKGLFRYNGTTWKRLSSLDPEAITEWGEKLAVDFGTGLFSYDGSSWTKLSSWDAEDMVEWGKELAVDFGTGKGLYSHDGASWSKLSSLDAEGLAAWRDGLAVDFGTGLFNYDWTSWKRLSTWDAQDIEDVDLD